MIMNNSELKQWQKDEALKRFQLISPLLQDGIDIAKCLKLRDEIAARNNISIRSLYQYEKAWKEGGFSGLKPASCEKRSSNKLPNNFAELLEQAIQLKREVPKRSVNQIIMTPYVFYDDKTT